MRDTKPKRNKLSERLSPDGKWRSFPKVPNLLQYCSTGLYFARLKVNGKLIRRSLLANTFEEARLALHDFLSREKKQRRAAGAPVTFRDARMLYEATVSNDATLAAQSVRYRWTCIKRLLKSWPELDGMTLRSINRRQCEEWAKRVSGEVHWQYFNNILDTFKGILKRGHIADDQYSPLYEIKRMGAQQVSPILPEPEQFLRMIQEIDTSGARQQHDCADFARFLAFSGCRLSEAKNVTWADVNLEKGTLTVHNAKVRRARAWRPTRTVPIIPDMRQLLEQLRRDNPQPTDRVCAVAECQKALNRACRLAGVERITHHDLRHLFATRCIEAGVDIPTVSRWLGHSVSPVTSKPAKRGRIKTGHFEVRSSYHFYFFNQEVLAAS